MHAMERGRCVRERERDEAHHCLSQQGQRGRGIEAFGPSYFFVSIFPKIFPLFALSSRQVASQRPSSHERYG